MQMTQWDTSLSHKQKILKSNIHLLLQLLESYFHIQKAEQLFLPQAGTPFKIKACLGSSSHSPGSTLSRLYFCLVT